MDVICKNSQRERGKWLKRINIKKKGKRDTNGRPRKIDCPILIRILNEFFYATKM